VVLIVEDEALVRMTAVDMIEEAGFEVLEATNADEAILLLEARRDITVVFTDIEMPGSMDGLRLAQAVRGRWPPIKIIATSGRYIVRDGDLPSGGAVPGKTVQLRPDFQRLTESHGPGLEHGLGRHPRAGSPVAAKKISRPLETGSTFSSFLHAAKSGPGALRGPGGDGRRRYPTPARTHLAQRRIWL
jgi:CheY-like chemotaxis protein